VSSQFVIGDFDGDRAPDMATVHQVRDEARSARYSIRLQLTTGTSGTWQTIGLTAPLGGLLIVARDVNGDSALDLVISTAWEHQAVAVLLNDGQGNFTPQNPTGFSTAIWERLVELTGQIAEQAQDKSLLGSRRAPSGSAEGDSRLSSAQIVSEPLLGAANSAPTGSPRLSPLGRAPPISNEKRSIP
jgi:hypothetical protein